MSRGKECVEDATRDALAYIERIERERAEFRNDALGCTSRIAALEAENETLRADAERYRWLRKRPVSADFGYSYQANEALDAAIDAARGE